MKMRATWRYTALPLAGALALACDGVDSRAPGILIADAGGGLGGSAPGSSGGGGAAGASGASGAASGAGSGGSSATGGTGGGAGEGSGGAGGSGGTCASGTKSCGGEVCVPEGACCSDNDCGGPGVGACGSDGQCSCVGSAFGASCGGRFIGLGVVGLVDSDSEARAISGDGRVVAGWSGVGTGQPHAARWVWELGQSESLGELESGGTSVALAVSNDGSVIVGDGSMQLISNSTAGFAWTQSTGMNALTAGEFVTVTHAEAVTSDGSTVVGWAIDDFDGIGAQWQGLNGALLPVSSPPDTVRLFATNGGGSLFGGDAAGNPITYAPESAGDNFQVLNSGPFAQGFVAAISPNGAHLAGTMDGAQAVRWFEGVGDPVELGAGLARDVNDAGIVVGESEGVAVIWSAAGQKTEVLSLLEAADVAARAGWSLQRAHGISDDGRVIVGAGARSGRQEGWLLRLPEAP